MKLGVLKKTFIVLSDEGQPLYSCIGYMYEYLVFSIFRFGLKTTTCVNNDD